MSNELINRAIKIIEKNDFGTYTIPTEKLYPFQWNWDSCLVSLGIAHSNEDRAWTEIETLFEHQWSDGMLPHIIFHERDDGYFPGPEVWGTNTAVATSGISQPPIAGFVIYQLFKNAQDKSMAKERASKLLPLVAAWHDWFFEFRDPASTGLVSIIHPWESGRDNSSDWDEALDRVPSNELINYPRKDTKHINPIQRPTNKEYGKYMALVELFKKHKWNNKVLHDVSPFQVVDPGFNAILIKSCFEIGCLANELGFSEISEKSFSQSKKSLSALETLWNESEGQYSCFDRKSKTLIKSHSIGCILPIFANIPKERADSIVSTILKLEKECKYLIPSHSPVADKFDSSRYWRGPAWLITNYITIIGLKQSNNSKLAERIINDSITLVEKSGFAEYYDPITGDPCGGKTFSWTAAMVIVFLKYKSNTMLQRDS